MEKSDDKINFNAPEDNKTDTKSCGFCSSSDSRYLCPRCGVRYCSVTCYKSKDHLICSEGFFKECIKEHLDSTPVDYQTRRQMMETLQKIQQESVDEDELIDSDDEVEDDLSTRLGSIDLNDANAVWQKLTDAEKAEFESLVSSGEVVGILPIWTPWWVEEKPLIQELDKEEKKIQYPEVVPNIPQFKTICKVVPSPMVKFNVINVLASYVFSMRHFNGDHEHNPQQSAFILLELSDNLKKNCNFTGMDLAVESVKLNSINIMKSSREDSELINTDVQAILKSRQFVQYALSDVHHFLCKAKLIGKSQRKQTTKKQEELFSRRFPESQTISTEFIFNNINLTSVTKKIEFYLSWCEDHFQSFSQAT